MRSIAAVVAAVAPIVGIAACAGADDCTVSAPGCRLEPLTIAITPRTVTLGVGDTATVRIAVTQGGRAVRATVRWTPWMPAVVGVDSATASRPQVRAPQVRVRGLAAGAGAVNAEVTVDAQTVTMSIPVTVVAR